MPPTSPVTSKTPRRRAQRRTRGFTLVEMSLVIVILLLIAAVVLPNLFGLLRARRLLDLEGRIARLPTQARNAAVRDQRPVRLRVDDNALVAETVAADGTMDPIRQVNLGSSIVVDSVLKDGQPADLGSWQWTVYPDGSADDGGIEFVEGAKRMSLILPAHGDSQWVRGDIPDQSSSRWPAGELQPRSQVSGGADTSAPTTPTPGG